MEKFTEFKTLKDNANSVLSKLRKLMEEEELIYNQTLPSSDKTSSGALTEEEILNLVTGISDKVKPTSTYISNDYRIASETYTEDLMQNFPTFEFDCNQNTLNKDQVQTLNDVFKRLSNVSALQQKMIDILRIGSRKGFCVAELVPSSTVNLSGEVLVDGLWKPATIIDENSPMVDLIRYRPENTYIDPTADPMNIRNTADYVIVDMGYYAVDVAEKMAKEKGWSWDSNILSKTNYNASYNRDTATTLRESLVGISQTGTKTNETLISKYFDKDGKVKIVANDEYVLWSGKNSKHINTIPLIFYISIAGDTAYGDMLFKSMKPSVLAKSKAVNFILDNVGRNNSMATITTSDRLANMDLTDPSNRDKVLYVPDANNMPIDKLLYRPQLPDISQATTLILNGFEMDIKKASRLNDLAMGSQGSAQIRTDSIAQMMNMGGTTKKSMFLKQAEFTFFQQFGYDLWWVLYSQYDRFSSYLGGVSRDLLKDVTNVRVKQGSTLPEDSMTKGQTLVSALQLVAQFAPDSYSMKDLLKDIVHTMGVNMGEYELGDQQMMMALLIKNGLPPDMAQQEVMRLLGNGSKE